MQAKPRICCVNAHRHWYAWREDDPSRKYRGRTHWEALGQLYVATEVPHRQALIVVGPLGRRNLLTPTPASPPETADDWARPDNTDPSLGTLAGYLEELRQRSHFAP